MLFLFGLSKNIFLQIYDLPYSPQLQTRDRRMLAIRISRDHLKRASAHFQATFHAHAGETVASHRIGNSRLRTQRQRGKLSSGTLANPHDVALLKRKTEIGSSVICMPDGDSRRVKPLSQSPVQTHGILCLMFMKSLSFAHSILIRYGNAENIQTLSSKQSRLGLSHLA